jgi:hypothetical protein
MTLDHTRVPGGAIMVLGIASATDEFAERETGHRDYFWGRPPRAGDELRCATSGCSFGPPIGVPFVAR